MCAAPYGGLFSRKTHGQSLQVRFLFSFKMAQVLVLPQPPTPPCPPAPPVQVQQPQMAHQNQPQVVNLEGNIRCLLALFVYI